MVGERCRGLPCSKSPLLGVLHAEIREPSAGFFELIDVLAFAQHASQRMPCFGLSLACVHCGTAAHTRTLVCLSRLHPRRAPRFRCSCSVSAPLANVLLDQFPYTPHHKKQDVRHAARGATGGSKVGLGSLSPKSVPPAGAPRTTPMPQGVLLHENERLHIKNKGSVSFL